MRHIEIEGKRYPLKGRFGTVEKLLRKYDLLKLKDGGWGDDEQTYIDFCLESTWKLIEPDGFFKPYIFFKRFKKRVLFEDIIKGQNSVLSILYGIPENDLNSDEADEDETTEKKSQKKVS
jgi:hypothetical protein